MKTLEQILTYKGGENCNFIDRRDVSRLAAFIPFEKWADLGLEPVEGFDISSFKPLELTRENVISKLSGDLEFAFDKALGKRGISSSLMHDVIRMWMWVLDDELQDCEDYPQYGLPLYKRVAVKYGLNNPIGDDKGNEYKYSERADYAKKPA